MSASDALVMADEQHHQQQQNVEAGQVKFTKDNESVDVNGEQKLIGLTKEQLERYRNDPLWKPIRYTLFALFWLLWIGMFVGAILIVVTSPRCAAKKERKWNENAVAYQIYTPTFRDSDADGVGDFNGIKEKLNDLRRIGVTTVWPTPLLASNKDDFKLAEIRDANIVDPRFGTEEDLKALIERAHDLNLYFVADLPLTLSADSTLAAKQGIGGAGKVRLLNLAVPDAWEGVKRVAAKLITLGVDGLNLAQYGLKYPAGSVDAQKLDTLAGEIRAENKEKFRDADGDNFIFIADSPAEGPTRSINFYTRSLGRFASTPNVCATADLLECLKESGRQGVGQQKRNATSLPLWQLGDVSHARLDNLLSPAMVNKSSQASALITAAQLMLPGAVKVYYGEELGLPSIGANADSQQGLMAWAEDGAKGFSDSTEQLFFKTLKEEQAKELNFKTQYDSPHSHLKVFKKLAQLRARDEVFTDGEFTSGKIEGLHVLVRSLPGNDKTYVLVANWPTNGDSAAKQFNVNQITQPFNIKAAGTVELLIDHPLNDKNEWHIQTDSRLTLEPLEFVLLRVEVLA